MFMPSGWHIVRVWPKSNPKMKTAVDKLPLVEEKPKTQLPDQTLIYSVLTFFAHRGSNW